MSKSSKKLNIKEALNLCGYNNNIKKSFILFLQSNYCNPKNKLYLFERNKNVPKLFLLLLKIPTKYNNSSYDISILVYFPLNFPNIKPEIYFHKYCSVKINPNCLNYIDEETLKINYEKFYKWNNSFESFKNLIKEIYKQFNINFPIFTFENKNEKKREDGDCILKQQCCIEVELRKPINKNNIQQKTQKTVKNQNNNSKINNNYDSSDNNKINLSSKEIITPDDINNIIKKNEQIFDKMKRDNTYVNTNNINNKNGNNVLDSSEPYDEEKCKNNLIKLLIYLLYPKINKINISLNNTQINLEKIKNNIISEIKDFEEIEKQSENVEKSIDLIKSDLNNYKNIFQSDNNSNEIKKDFSNLDSILNIKNKNYYILLSKEKAIEEFILILKKFYEKHNIEFETAMNLVRTYSREIFYIKYKYNRIKLNLNKSLNI